MLVALMFVVVYLLACARADTHGLGCERSGGEVLFTRIKH